MNRGPTPFESHTMARKGDLELRLDVAKRRLAEMNPNVPLAMDFRRLAALYIDMMAVIDRHVAEGNPGAGAEPRGAAHDGAEARPREFDSRDRGQS